MRDEIYKNNKEKQPFTFGQETANVFDDMMDRSIPNYQDMQHLIAHLTNDYYQPNTNIYDIGCSTGNTIKAIHTYMNETPPIFAIDKSPEMIEKAKQKVNDKNIQWITKGAEEVSYSNASIIISSYVLQFISVEERARMIQEFYDALTPGGILILCEKVLPSPTTINEYENMYNNYKLRSGYSQLEIDQKKEALQNVLVPLSYSGYHDMLSNSGFTTIDIALKFLHFTCIVAIK